MLKTMQSPLIDKTMISLLHDAVYNWNKTESTACGYSLGLSFEIYKGSCRKITELLFTSWIKKDKVLKIQHAVKNEICFNFEDCCLLGCSTVIAGDRPDDGGSKDLWNVGKLLLDYTVLEPRRQPSSYSPPWEPQILLIQLCFLRCCAEFCLARLPSVKITDWRILNLRKLLQLHML
jgi:hypothetical protein